ncbi:MAG: Rrf2 family transcriptional regulator [Verrucomicrobia bacterium]|nr:Rrf2 family transcriptional regulator [Verrucomicrobiota bacterium]
MKISSRSRYALLTVLDLALHREVGITKVHEIARRQGIPQKFLEQILLVLKSGGIVISRRGAKGGYLLAKTPADISVADVLQLTEDAILAKDETNTEGAAAVFDDVWSGINDRITRNLSALTFQDLVERAEKVLESEVWQYTI